MDLKHKKETTIRVSYKDLDAFIVKHYGQPFEVTASEEARNDSCLSFTVAAGQNRDYDTEYLKEFREKGRYGFLLGTILNDLCDRGLIEAGSYVVDICW